MIRKELLPNLLDTETNLTKFSKISLPVRTVGLKITLPEDSAHEYERSKAMSDYLSDNGPIVAENRQFALAAALKKEKQQIAKAKESAARVDLNSEELYSLDLAAENGS